MTSSIEIGNVSSLYQLSGCLGSNEHVASGNPLYNIDFAVNNVKTRRNTKLNGSYVVGGSTYVCSILGVKSTLMKRWFKMFQSRYKLEDDCKPFFVVHGHLHSRSPLLHWTLMCKFRGFISSEDSDAEFTSESNALLNELNIDRNHSFSLLSKTACAFVFDIAYAVGPPEKLSWCLPCHHGGKHHNKYLGNNLRRLGLCVPKNVSNYPLNKRDFQLLRIKIAEYGVPDDFNFTKLSLLNNKHLKDILRVKRRSGKVITFPNFTFYGHRILEAARYHNKSDLYCKILSKFPPSYGQLLHDKLEYLEVLDRYFDGTDYLDKLFYGEYDYCFSNPPHKNQVSDTIENWLKYGIFDECRFEGWEKRFDEWCIFYNQKQWNNVTLFNKFDVDRLNNCVVPTILKQSSCGELFMFPSDYDLYRKFVRYLFQSDGTVFPNDLYLQGVEYAKMDDCLYMFSNLGVKRHCDLFTSFAYSKKCFIVLKHQQYVYYDREFSFGNHWSQYELDNTNFKPDIDQITKALASLSDNARVCFVGMEYWPIDILVMMLNVLEREKHSFVFHWFGNESITMTSKGSYRLSPILHTFKLDLDFNVTLLKNIDNMVNETEINDIGKWYRSFCHTDALSRNGFLYGVQIVCCYNEYIEKAKKEFPRNMFLQEEHFHTNRFYIGDRVITKFGFISHITNIRLNGSYKASVKQDVYVGCAISLEGIDNNFHATELRLAYVLNHNDILFPLPNVLLYGKFPDYVRKQYESSQCTNELFIHNSYCSKDTELSELKNKEVILNARRCNALSIALIDHTKNDPPWPNRNSTRDVILNEKTLEENKVEREKKRKLKLKLVLDKIKRSKQTN